MTNYQENIPPIQALIVNGFVGAEGGGNPAGVVLDADELSPEQMQVIAHKIDMPETAFVSESKTEGLKLDFFTPNRRIAHCGHATIATFAYLLDQGKLQEGVTSKETVDGPRKIVLKNGEAFMEQLAPKYNPVAGWSAVGVSLEDVLISLGLQAEELDPRLEPVVVNTGNSFLLVGVPNGDILSRIVPDLPRISEISDRLDLIGFYVFTTAPDATDRDATTRMFGPRYAIDEEAGTGMAAGPLACVLYDKLGMIKDKIVIEQGVYMTPASPSLITVDLDIEDGKITGLMAGGKGKMVRQLELQF